MSKLLEQLKENYTKANKRLLDWSKLEEKDSKKVIDSVWEDIKKEIETVLKDLSKSGIKRFQVSIDDDLTIRFQHKEKHETVMNLIRAGICKCSSERILIPEKVEKLISVYPEKTEEAIEYLRGKIIEYFNEVGLTFASAKMSAAVSELIYEINI